MRPSLGRYGRAGVERLGDFEEVVRLQAGIRDWLLRAARYGRDEPRGLPAPAVLPFLCAAAFGPALAESAELGGAAAVARLGVLSSVGASALGDLVAAAVDRARSAHPAPGPSRSDLQREIRQSLAKILSAGAAHSGEVRSDIAMVLREIDAGGTVFRAAIESGDKELEHRGSRRRRGGKRRIRRDGIPARRPGAGGRGDTGQPGRPGCRAAHRRRGGRGQAADVRVIREELAVMQQRTRQWLPGPGEPEPGRVRVARRLSLPGAAALRPG